MGLKIMDTIVFVVAIGFALGTAYVRISSTLMGYDIGEMKHEESMLLQERSRLNMELAKLTSKKNLTMLTEKRREKTNSTETLASY